MGAAGTFKLVSGRVYINRDQLCMYTWAFCFRAERC